MIGGAAIADIENFVRSRQRRGKTPTEAREDLMRYGYDFHAASALVMRHWDHGDRPE